MASNAKRLYVALYPSGVVNNEERRYHWGFLVGPRTEIGLQVQGKRYHVKNSILGGWEFEETPLRNVQNTGNLLVRILIANVDDEARLAEVLRRVPVVQNDPSWRCRSWIADALEALKQDGRAMTAAVPEWRQIEYIGRWYAAEKTNAGRYNDSRLVHLPRPTWDMLQNREILP